MRISPNLPFMLRKQLQLWPYLVAIRICCATAAYLLVIASVPVISQVVQQLWLPKAAHGCLGQPCLLQQVCQLVAAIST